jgi:hypothetical protein
LVHPQNQLLLLLYLRTGWQEVARWVDCHLHPAEVLLELLLLLKWRRWRCCCCLLLLLL